MSKGYKKRMKKEYKELHERLSRLSEFMRDDEKFYSLSTIDRDLLSTQYYAMMTYSSTLYMRIKKSKRKKNGRS